MCDSDAQSVYFITALSMAVLSPRKSASPGTSCDSCHTWDSKRSTLYAT